MKLTDERLEQLLSQQAEQAGEIWERSLPDEPEQPHTFSKQFERRMRWLIWRRRHPAHKQIRNVAAAVVVCLGIGFFTPTAPAEAARRWFYEAITRVTVDWTETTYSSSTLEADDFIPSEPTYIPVGLQEKQREVSDIDIHLFYKAENGDYLDYRKSFLGDSTAGFDSEDAYIETVKVMQDENALFVSEDGVQMLIWTDWNSRYILMSNLPKNELIKIANSTKKINN